MNHIADKNDFKDISLVKSVASELNENPDFIQLTKLLYLDSILEGRYTEMDYKTSLNESEKKSEFERFMSMQ